MLAARLASLSSNAWAIDALESRLLRSTVSGQHVRGTSQTGVMSSIVWVVASVQFNPAYDRHRCYWTGAVFAGPRTATRMVLSRTLRRCLRYFYASVDVYSSVGVFGGSLSFVCAFEEFQLRLRAASCLVDARRPWKPCQTAL